MAVLNKIRQRSVFLIIIIALALFSFVLADVLRNGGLSTDKSQANVATVNGVDLERTEFMTKVENMRRNLGPNAPAGQAINAVYEQEVRRVVLEEQYEELGLTVQGNQLNDALSTTLAGNETFQDEAGRFSQAKLDEYIASIRTNRQASQQWDDFVESNKKSILENTYFTMVKAGLTSTLAEGEQEYRYENDKVNLQFAYIPFTKIPDEDVTVTDAEIEAYIKDNKKEFEVEPEVDIQYVTISGKASQEDIDEARTSIEELLKDTVEYNEVSKLNDTITGFANTNDVEAFVNANSETPYQDRWMYKQDVPLSIRDTVFTMNPGAIYGPYKVDNTFNLTKVVAKRQLPDSAKVRHILIPIGLNQTDSITRTKEEAKKTADSLLAILKTNKNKFPEFVEKHSSDVASIEKDGVYDFFPYNQMVPAFRDYSFEKNVGDMGVVETRFGYHLIEVLGQKNPKDVIKIATVTKDIETSEKTLNNVFSEATNFELDAQKGDFAETAKAASLPLKPVNKIGKLDATIPGVGNNREIVKWAFEEETNVGDIKRFGVGDDYIIAQLTRKSPKGLMSIAEASPRVTPILRKEKKAEKIKEGVSGTTVQEVASSQGVTVQTATAVTMASPTIPGAGNEPLVVGTAFGKEAGQETDLIVGENGVYKVRVLAFNPAPDLDNYASYANQLTAKETPAVNGKVYTALKEAAEIEDNRANFF
ncbi:SurA N-terminal domain-containing protein [Marinirhabdus gelatinilytica]|uniref:Periplasmic chaperone PpiD n=1 Tax=Marinirhabdus gelatinilytica TaxID=1703343 RepID=A0A370QL49_9FLAO|nr:SurA N-terminal domain-containing protein [Marinirhabdus gelatinilytica]RDK89078.1 peptidylprolyl isomerase/peptidyl-prolyl cis-trans isomerase D [Marinirhabdus gelatinilytica]